MYKAVFHVSYCIEKRDLESLNKLAYFKAKGYQVCVSCSIPPTVEKTFLAFQCCSVINSWE